MENRESFFARLNPFHTPNTIVKIELAYTLSKFGHSYQTRKQNDSDGNPIRYFEHPRSAAIIMMDEIKIYDYEMVCAALMHDLIEDSRNVPANMIESVFGTDVCRILKTLSKCPKEGYLDRFKVCKDFRPFIIKACDKLDNLRTLDGTSQNFKDKQIKETKEHYFDLFEIMLDICPKEYYKNCLKARDLVREQIARIDK